MQDQILQENEILWQDEFLQVDGNLTENFPEKDILTNILPADNISSKIDNCANNQFSPKKESLTDFLPKHNFLADLTLEENFLPQSNSTQN